MKRAVVIGGASGIGLATVDALTAEGVEVVVADIDAERAETIAAERGDTVRALHLDVTDEDSVVAAFDAIGEFDTVVN